MVADITGTNLNGGGGGSGLADMYVEPVNFGWHLGDRVDFQCRLRFHCSDRAIFPRPQRQRRFRILNGHYPLCYEGPWNDGKSRH